MRFFAWVGAAAVVAGWIVACVGDDPASKPTADPSVPVGQWKGACTTDGKCIEGLLCNQGVCLYAGDGAPPVDGSASSSGGSSSGGSSSGSNVVACGASLPSSDPSLDCGGGERCASECCVGPSGPSACDATCATISPRRSFKCDSKYQCTNSGDECCLATTTAITLTSCPSSLAFVDVTESICVNGGCDTGAGSNQYKMCRTDAECTAPAKCRQVEINTGGSGTKLLYGVCISP